MSDRANPSIIIAASAGAAISAILLMTITAWPEHILSGGSVRTAIGVGAVVAFVSWCSRRQARRIRRLEALILATSVSRVPDDLSGIDGLG